ncbi:MAG: DUF3307 domain-containing protein [Spirosomaceae bacterium]|nr:DUF3307 domain-containing protein [Spirosomataceae bacterium]
MTSLPSGFVLILLKLCIAHLISDYFLQFDSWVADKQKNKIRSIKLYAHIAVTFLAAALISGEWLIALFIAVTHGIIDITKIYLGKKDSVSFIIDQALHFIILVISSLWISNELPELLKFAVSLSESTSFWAIAFGYMFITFPISVVITILTHRWRKDLDDSYENLQTLNEAGKWIGIMERLLILTFILINQFAAIGFLIAAKAVLRIKDTERKLSEYVLIGTLLSICITVCVGLLIKFITLA